MAITTSPAELITIRELLRDPQYKKFFTSVPELPGHYKPEMKPWKLYVLKEGEHVWRSKRFGTYRDAFAGFKTMLPTLTNAAINCPALGFMPPVRNVRVKGKVDGRGKPIIKSLVWKPHLTDDMSPHNWCPHCRRPSIFRYALPKKIVQASGLVLPQGEPALRCIICGASENVVDLRHPENAQKWDTNRPRIYTK